MSNTGRPQRNRRLPARFQDLYPEPPLPATPALASTSTHVPGSVNVQRVSLIVRNPFQTRTNGFGLWKEYQYRPSYDPDAFVPPEDLYRPHTSTVVPQTSMGVPEESSLSGNRTIELLLDWQNTGSSEKSNDELDRLVHGVLLNPSFQLSQLESFKATRENRKADAAEETSPFLQSFQCADISIEVPSGSRHIPPRMFSIPGLYYRNIVGLIKETFRSPISSRFHLVPYKLFRQHPNGETNDRVYSELYDSDTFLDEHDKVQRAPTDDHSCKREKIVAALMFWSDATHLATFGTAKMWPIYMQFGNLSKYTRAKPTSGAIKHLAYFPPFPDSLQDKLKGFHQKWDSQQRDILTHCRQELVHAVWKFLLNEDFLHAYRFRIVVQCQDGLERCVYPRVFTYSADYPEK